MNLHPKIQERKTNANPINYNFIDSTDHPSLEKRASLLDQGIIEGYGAIWGSKNMHREIFLRGAFLKSIESYGPDSNSNYKLKMRADHGVGLALFDEIREDDIGLYFRTVKVDDIPEAKRTLTQLKSGTINNFSVGYRYIWDKMSYDDENDTIFVHEAGLLEISTVTIPSDLDTFAIRSAQDIEDLMDDTEDFIQSLPRKMQLQARQLFSHHKSLSQIKPNEFNNRSLDEKEPRTGGTLDLAYLTENLNLNI